MSNSILEKIGRIHSSNKIALLAYVNDEVKAFRSDSTAVDKLSKNSIIGVYNAKASKTQILEDIECYLSEYAQRQTEKSERFAKQVGMAG